MVDRDLVEDLLSDATHPDADYERVEASTLAALCRSWLALQDAPEVEVREASFSDGRRVGKLIATTDQSMIGQRVRIVKEVE